MHQPFKHVWRHHDCNSQLPHFDASSNTYLNAWSPKSLSNREAKSFNFCIQFIPPFCCTGFWWPWRSRAHMVAWESWRITSRNMVMFFPRKNKHRKSQGKDIGIKWNRCISMYPPIFGQKVWKFKQDMFFFLVEGTDFFRENTQHLSNSEMRQFADLDPMYGGVAGRVLGPFATRSHPQRANDSGHRWGMGEDGNWMEKRMRMIDVRCPYLLDSIILNSFLVSWLWTIFTCNNKNN